MQRSLSYGSQAGLTIVIFGAILGVLYLIAMNHNPTWDLAQGNSNRLDQKTLGILAALKTDVDIKVFDKSGAASAERAKDLLKLYTLKSRHITYAVIDPDSHPDQARTLGVERYGQAVLVGAHKKEYIDTVDEQGLTTALLKLGQSHAKVIYCVEGHGEKRISDGDKNGILALHDALVKDNYTVKPLVLMREAIPADAAGVAIIGPEKGFLHRSRCSEGLSRSGRQGFHRPGATQECRIG